MQQKKSPDAGVHETHASVNDRSQPLVWLEHIRPIAVQSNQDGEFQIGALHSVDWATTLLVLPFVTSIVSDVINDDGFKVDELSFLHHDKERRLARPGIGLFMRGGHCLDSQRRQIEAALTGFFQTIVFGSDEMQVQSSLAPIEMTESVAVVVRRHSDRFRDEVGYKQIREPFMVRTQSLQLRAVGNFRPSEQESLPKSQAKTIRSFVDGIKGSVRILFINSSDGRGSFGVRFDEEQFLAPILARLLDKHVYEFEIVTEWIRKTKKIDRLVAISDA